MFIKLKKDDKICLKNEMIKTNSSFKKLCCTSAHKKNR